MTHRTGVGHIEAAQIVSWACTCGTADVLDFGDTFNLDLALDVATRRASGHLADAHATDRGPR